MAVPTLITDLSTTAASNAPAGSDSVFPDLDNFIRQYGAFIAQLNATDALKAPIASPTFTGNAGFGVTPQTWGTNFRALQFGAVGALAYDNNFGQVYLGSNFYMAGSGVGTPTYISSNSAARLDVTQSGFSFKLASSGSAGAPITWTNVASIDATDGPQRATDATTSNGLVRKSQMDTADGLRCLKANNLSDVASTATALTNLGGVASSAFTGSNQSLGIPGYQKLPGGLIIQWGTVAPNSGAAFAIAFPTICASLQLTSAPVVGGGYPVVTALTTTGFNQSNNNNAYYLAIGW